MTSVSTSPASNTVDATATSARRLRRWASYLSQSFQHARTNLLPPFRAQLGLLLAPDELEQALEPRPIFAAAFAPPLARFQMVPRLHD